MTRCFVGFELTEESRGYLHERVAALHTVLQDHGRWPLRMVRPENWHATLLFFNDLTGDERAEVWEAVEAGARNGAWRNLAFAWSGLTLWPNPRRPSLICLEAEPYAAAADWPVAPLLEREPFSKADVRHFSPYRPHVTAIRFDPRWRRRLKEVWDDAVVQAGAKLPPFDPGAIGFDRVSFFLSTLSAAQPVYPRERTVPLE